MLPIGNITYESARNKSLFFAFIDFKKAYDSVDRKRLIEVLIEFNINPHIINILVQMYEGDKTTILLGRLKETIDVTCGIRQGCCISTLLFKLVTFTFIRKLRTKADQYEIGVYKDY